MIVDHIPHPSRCTRTTSLPSCRQDNLLLLLTPNLEIHRKRFRSEQPGRGIIPNVIVHGSTGGLVDGGEDVKRPQQSRRQDEEGILRQVVARADAATGAEGPMVSEFDVVGVDALSRREVVDRSVVESVRVEPFRVREEFGVEV